MCLTVLLSNWLPLKKEEIEHPDPILSSDYIIPYSLGQKQQQQQQQINVVSDCRILIQLFSIQALWEIKIITHMTSDMIGTFNMFVSESEICFIESFKVHSSKGRGVE